MAKNTCRIPSVLDEQFARLSNTHAPIIANLRGLYEAMTGDTINSIDEYTTKLVPFKNKMLQEDRKRLEGILNCSKQDILSTAYRMLRRDFSNNGEIRELVNLIYTKFTEIVDSEINMEGGEIRSWLQEARRQGKHISRQEIIRRIGYDKIHLYLVNEIEDSYYNPKRKTTYLNSLLGKMIDGGHIDTFFWLAKDEIAQREGVKFGKKMAFVVEFKNDETLEADYRVEDSIKDGWMREIDKENPFKTIGQEVRSYLGRQRMYKTNQEFRMVTNKATGKKEKLLRDIPLKTKNGFVRLQNPVKLHKVLQSLLVGCRDQKHMMELIARAARTDVNMKHIYQDLLADSQLRDAFYRDFHKTNCKYSKIYTTFSNGLRRLHHSIIRSNSRKLSFYHYSNSLTKESSLSETIFDEADGEIVVSGDKWNILAQYIQDKISGNSLDKISVNTTYNSSADSAEASGLRLYAEVKDVVDTINSALGLGLTDRNIEDLIKNKVSLKSFLLDAKKLSQDKRVKSGMSVGSMTSMFKDRITAMLTTANEADSTASKSVRIGDSTYFTDIVTCKLANTIDYVRSFANDARYYLSLDSKAEQDAGLEKVVADIKAWILDKYGCSSEYFTVKDGRMIFYNKWIDDLYNTNVESLTDPDSFIYSFTYDRAMLFDGILAEDFSAEFDLRTFISNYFSLNTDADRGYARYPVFTTGDSLALKMITAPKFGYDKLMNEFTAVARQEIERMKVEARVAETLDANGLSKGKITSLADTSGELSGKFVYLSFLNKYKSELKEALDNGTFNDKCKEILKKELFDEYQNEFWNEVKDLDTFTVSDDGMAFKELGNLYALSPTQVGANDGANGMLMYYLNTKLAYILQYQFLGANPAAYGLSTAMQKRYKAQNAPGNSMDIYATDFNGNLYIEVDADGNPIPEKVLYFSDMIRSIVDTDPEFMKALEERWGKDDPRYQMYADGSDSTDGQGFRTVASYRRVMGMAHQWTQEQENAYNRLQEIRRASWERAAKKLGLNMNVAEDLQKAKLNATLTVEEIDELNDLNVVFQPIKPHTSTVEKVPTDRDNPNSDVLLIPVEHKYAEALIIPEMFPIGSFRKALGVEMEAGGIDLACSQQCVKVGEFGAADFRNSTAETFSEDFSKGYIHNIDYADYTIQTNVPEHINASQLFGTQLRKHVFDAINLVAKYSFGDIDGVNIHGITRMLTGDNGGKNFLKFYNALICENMGHDLVDLSRKISDIGKLSDMLTELKGNDSASTIEDVMRFSVEDGHFNNPISEPSGAYDVESILTSIFKREVNKQHINGGSCVQVSDFGINGYGSDLHVHTEVGPDGKTNITYVDCAMAFDLSWTDVDGNKVPLKFSNYCNEDGTLITLEDGTTKIEKDYPGILDLVAYRIPTEREYSILNLRVKRFYPKMMGAAIMVPSQYTTVAGFDFDIDKLYYFRKEFKQSNRLPESDINKVWNDIYGIEITEEGLDTSKATTIYTRLDEARQRAIKAYNEISKYSDINEIEDENARFEALLGITGNSDVTETNPRNKKLYTFWEDAGLSEELGMSASEYFGQFLSQNKFKYVVFDEYDPTVDVAENSVVARNNMLIRCIQSRLTDPATFDARYTPGGFTNAKRDSNVLKAILYSDDIPAEVIRRVIGKDKITSIEDAENFADNATKKDLETLDVNRDVTNVLTTCDYNARNRVASKVIGIMANHNTNAVYSKSMQRLALREPIKIFGYSLQDLNSSNTGRDYMLTLAELLASSVDAVKTPVLNFLNINSYTASVAALLARLGLSTEEIGLFLNQPIIREVCTYAANSGTNSVTTAINKIAMKYKLELKGDYSGSLINKIDLYSTLRETALEGNKRQENILKAFRAISSQAQALSDFIGKTKYTAANSIDNSIGGMIALVYDNKAANEKETAINKHLVMDFGNFDDKAMNEEANELSSPIRSDENISLEYMQTPEYKEFLDGTPLAFEQMVHDAVTAYIQQICKYFPYTTPQYRAAYDTIYSNVIFGTMDKEIVDAINSQLPVFILNTRPDSPFNPDSEYVGDGENKMFYTVEFPRQLREFLNDRENLKGLNIDEAKTEFEALKQKYSWLEGSTLQGILENELLDNLIIDEYSVQTDDIFDDNGIRFNIGIDGNSQFDKDIKDGLSSAWEDLLADKTKAVLNPRTSLAHALFMYNFFIRGYEVGNNAFSNITPLSVKNTLMVTPYMPYNSFYNGLNNGDISTINLNAFIPLFYANNIGNSKLVKTLYNLKINEGLIKVKGLPEGRVISELGMPTIIEFDGGEKQDYGELSLPSSKRNKRPGTRAVISAFKINDRSGSSRLFVLMPNTYTGSYALASSEYNVRPVNSKNRYIEIPVKGIKGTVADYSLSDLPFVTSQDITSIESDSTVDYTNDTYVEEEIDDLGDYRSEVRDRQEAANLAERAKENKKKNGFCN